MQVVKIITEINDDNKDFCNGYSIFALNSFLILIITFILCLYFTSVRFFVFLKEKNYIDLEKFIQNIKDCNISINYDRDKIYNNFPYTSVCIPVYNIENYFENQKEFIKYNKSIISGF